MPNPKSVRLIREVQGLAASPTLAWALEHLNETLEAAGVAVDDAGTPIRVLMGADVSLPGLDLPGRAEAFALTGGDDGITAWGFDDRGLVYAITELADRIAHGSFPGPLPMIEAPANRIRSVTRIFASEREDKVWFQDRSFWTRYLTMLAANRFNRFSLTMGIGYDYPYHNHIISDVYLHFPYPYLVDVAGYGVRARGLPVAERESNLAILKFIGAEAARRGLDFQLGLWTQRYDFDDVPNANYVIEGITRENNASYCRDAVARLLAEVPQITGLTFRIHVEGGVSEGDYDFWRTVWQGVKSAGRPIEIDMHAKGLDDPTLAMARESGMPITVSPKYLAEHMGLPYHTSAIREREYPPKVAVTNREKLSVGSRRFTRQSYGDFLRVGRDWKVVHRMWPGTQRVLTWGDPVFAAAYGRSASFCDSDGIELMEPLSFKGRQGSGISGGRAVLKLPQLATRHDWEKHAYYYRLWGRNLFSPGTDADGHRRHLAVECGEAAPAVERGLGAASRILPLVTHAHGASIANNNYWPEIYTNMPVVTEGLERPMGGDMDKPTRFGNAPTFDPQMFCNGRALAARLLKGETVTSHTPMDVAGWLTAMAAEAENAVIDIRGTSAAQRPAVKRLLADMRILAGLGRYFAGKFRASCWGEVYLATWHEPARLRALDEMRQARDGWKDAVDHSRELYQDDLTFGPGPHLRGSWQNRLDDIEREVKELATFALREWPEPDHDAAAAERAMARLAAAPPPRASAATLSAPETYTRGQPVEVTLSGAGDGEALLFFRPVNQAQRWSSMPMEKKSGRLTATIPAEAVDGEFHLQCYAVLPGEASAVILPGFNDTLSRQPYLLIRQR